MGQKPTTPIVLKAGIRFAQAWLPFRFETGIQKINLMCWFLRDLFLAHGFGMLSTEYNYNHERSARNTEKPECMTQQYTMTVVTTDK